MKVAVVTSLYPSPPRPREGVFAERRWQGMAARGHEVRIVHPQPRAPGLLSRGRWAEIAAMPAREERGGLVVRRPRYWHWPGRAVGNARRFARVAAGALGEPEVVVCDYAWPASALAPLLAERGVPCVVNGRGSDVLEVAGEAGLGAVLARWLVSAGHWCAVSRDLVDAMDRLAGRPGRGVLVPNGVDLELFRPVPRGPARARLSLAPDGALVLVVGHLIPRKEPLLALAAFAAFAHRAPAGASLVFVGRGPLAGELTAAAASAGLSERVRLAGECSPEELADWYAAADVLLLTSRREGRPNVVLEALASGRPVLATAAGGTAEILSDERMLSASREPRELGERLARLLAEPPEPEELRARVAHLSWDASATALEQCLRAACAAVAPGTGERTVAAP